MRTFGSGATRNNSEHKIDYEGFLSPLAIRAFGRYMHKNRKEADGKIRASDNWQKGIPKEEYMKSIWRHLMHVQLLHDGYEVYDDDTGEEVSLSDALCGLYFNTQGYLHEISKDS